MWCARLHKRIVRPMAQILPTIIEKCMRGDPATNRHREDDL